MSNPYQLFETSKNLESGAGVTLEYPGFSITINRAGGSNSKYKKTVEEKTRNVRAKIQSGTLSDDEANKIFAEVYAESVIVRWDGVCDRDGNLIEFTKENVVKLLLDLPELFKDIQTQAENIDLFKARQEEADTKN